MADALRKHQATNVDELLAGQQRLQAVLDSIDDGLLIIDRQGRLEHLNPVAQRQLGWDTTASARAWPKRCSARSWSSNCARCCAAAAWSARRTT
jgi:transcriptional regulator with PAS, ATPase and Fis domain